MSTRARTAAAGKSTAVAKPQASQVPAELDYGQEANQGFEGVSGNDFIIPAIVVLQGLSPQVSKKVGQGGVEGARAGMFMHGITNRLIDGDKGFGFVPVMFDTDFVKWKTREAGGGILGRYRPEAPEVLEITGGKQVMGKIKIDDNTELVETKYIYGHMLDGEDRLGDLAVVRFTGTKIQPYKRFVTALSTFRRESGIKAPLYANRVRLTTVEQTNNLGDFFNISIEPLLAGDKNTSAYVASLIPKTNAALLEELRLSYDRVSSQREAIVIQGEEQGEGGDKEIPF